MGSSRRALQARIVELEARVAQLAARQSGAGSAVGEASPAEEVRDRRAFLRMAGVGAAAAAGGLLAERRPAAADDPNDVVLNVNNQAVTGITGLRGTIGGAPIRRLENLAGGAESRGLLRHRQRVPASAPSGATTSKVVATAWWATPSTGPTSRPSARASTPCSRT